jgi:hypothetical protein
MSKFRKWRWAAVLLASLAVVIGVYGWSYLSQPAPAEPWEKVQPRLRQFDRSADAAANKRLQSVRLFFKQREPGANKFAVEVLSWSGKWELAKDTIGVGDHRARQRDYVVRGPRRQLPRGPGTRLGVGAMGTSSRSRHHPSRPGLNGADS